MADFPTQAQVVIIGGGVGGCSIAYHLTQMGWKDVVVIERHENGWLNLALCRISGAASLGRQSDTDDVLQYRSLPALEE